MNEKEFDRFQTALQWVADDADARAHGEDRDGLRHHQDTWGEGFVLPGGPVKETTVKNHFTEQTVIVKWSAVCATDCCLAGNVVIANGDVMLVSSRSIEGHERGEVEVSHCMSAEGDVHDIPTRAQELLGLTAGEAHALFDGGNTAQDLLWRGKGIAAEYGHELRII